MTFGRAGQDGGAWLPGLKKALFLCWKPSPRRLDACTLRRLRSQDDANGAVVAAIPASQPSFGIAPAERWRFGFAVPWVRQSQTISIVAAAMRVDCIQV